MTRKYTLAEIDEMRRLVKHAMSPRYFYKGEEYVKGDTYSCGIGGGEMTLSAYAVDPAMVEDRLRTYMTAGIGPEDLKGAE